LIQLINREAQYDSFAKTIDVGMAYCKRTAGDAISLKSA